VEIAMKIKWIVTCVCLGMLGSTLSCAGEEEATKANAETAVKQPEARKAPAPAAKPAKSKERPAAKAKDAESAGSGPLTNADCFPDKAPDSAPSLAQTCVNLAKSAPDMAFTKRDYDGMPDDCRPVVLPKCRFD
jgi:hypothetical protein